MSFKHRAIEPDDLFDADELHDDESGVKTKTVYDPIKANPNLEDDRIIDISVIDLRHKKYHMTHGSISVAEYKAQLKKESPIFYYYTDFGERVEFPRNLLNLGDLNVSFTVLPKLSEAKTLVGKFLRRIIRILN